MKLQALKSLLIKRASKLDNPSLEVRIIIEKACGLPLDKQIMNPSLDISQKKEKEAIEILDKRLSGYPMAYIIGEKEFYGHTFKVTPDVLIPRPDTEIIVQKAIEVAKEKGSDNLKILDLCTGSGAIGTSIAYELDNDVFLSDISKEALDVAIYNYKNIRGKEPVAKVGSLFEPWDNHTFDIIATNPPYLTNTWYEETDMDVKKEPKLALIGFGDDGLNIIRRIIELSPRYLNKDGFLLIEGDYRQMEICAKLLSLKGFKDVGIIKDLANKDRVVYGRCE